MRLAREQPHYVESRGRSRRDLLLFALGLPLLLLAAYVAVWRPPPPDAPPAQPREEARLREGVATLERLQQAQRQGRPVSAGDWSGAFKALAEAGVIPEKAVGQLARLAAEGGKEIVVDTVKQLVARILARPDGSGPVIVIVNEPAPVTLTCAPRIRVGGRADGGGPPPRGPGPPKKRRVRACTV